MEAFMSVTEAIVWFCTWPIAIWVSYKFVMINLNEHDRLEALIEGANRPANDGSA